MKALFTLVFAPFVAGLAARRRRLPLPHPALPPDPPGPRHVQPGAVLVEQLRRLLFWAQLLRTAAFRAVPGASAARLRAGQRRRDEPRRLPDAPVRPKP